MTRKETNLIAVFTIINILVFYGGSLFARWMLSICEGWIYGILQVLWVILILLLLILAIYTITLAETMALKTIKSQKLYFQIQTYPIMVAISFCILQPKEFIGYLIMSIVWIVAVPSVASTVQLQNATDPALNPENTPEKPTFPEEQ
jgi:hypothetical protein